MQEGTSAITFLRPTLTEHVLLVTAATGHVRTAELRKSAQDPLEGFSGQSASPTLPLAYRATLIDPARALHDLHKLAVPESASDADVFEMLRNAGHLDGGTASQWLEKIVFECLARMPAQNVTAGHVSDATHLILEKTERVKSIKAADFRKAGWMCRCFTTERYGVSAPQGAVIVALNLLMARPRIEACVDAILATRALPTFELRSWPDSIGNNALARATEALRVEGQSDKSAPPEIADVYNHNCKQLVMKTRKKSSSGEIDAAMIKLRIDPAEFFRVRED